MKKKLLSVLLAVAMIASYSVPVFADDVNNQSVPDENEITIEDVEDVEAVITDSVDMSKVDNDIEIEGDSFIVESEDVEIEIPDEGDGEIVIEQEDSEPISMELPREVVGTEGELTDSGTIIYDPEDANMSVGIQALSGGARDNEWNAVRAMIEIDNAEAEKEYGFMYNIPEEYKLIRAEEWYSEYVEPTLNEEVDINKEDFFVPGEIYVIDGDGIVVESVDPAWAKDANGNSVPTHYEIRGNELVQVVDFNESNAFPIVADPTKHPDKTKVYYLTKSQVKTVRNKYTGKTSSIITSGIITTAVGYVNVGIGTGFALVYVSNQAYDNSKYNTWNKLYEKFPSNMKYLKVTGTWKWHGGHKTYYPSGKLKTKYVKKKG